MENYIIQTLVALLECEDHPQLSKKKFIHVKKKLGPPSLKKKIIHLKKNLYK